MLTIEIINESPTICGDLNLKSILHKNFSSVDEKSIFISAKIAYERLINNFISKEGKESFDSSTFFNPQYKLIKHNNNVFNLIIITPFGIYNTIEIIRKNKINNKITT